MKSFILFFILFFFHHFGIGATISSWEHFHQEGQKLGNKKFLIQDNTSIGNATSGDGITVLFDRSDSEINNKRADHITPYRLELNKKLYTPTAEVYLDFLSFQDVNNSNSSISTNKLVTTNSGYCLGGSYGKANNKFHFFGDGCFYYGWANVGPKEKNITYKQNDIETFGLKVAPAAGIFVSPEKVEIGLKLPIFFIDQKTSTLDKNQFPGYQIDRGSNIKILGSLYFRGPIKECLLQMELAKFIDKDTTLWSLGTGFRF
jgi:hypothetical protein